MKKIISGVVIVLVLALAPLLALMYVAQPSSARQEPNDDQVALINILARVYYIENRCPSLKVNKPVFAVLAHAKNLDLDDLSEDGRLRPIYSRAYRGMRDQFVSDSEKEFCLAAKIAFGPNGVKIPNAMILR